MFNLSLFFFLFAITCAMMSNTPLLLSIALILSSLSFCLILWQASSWLAIATALIFIGGVMVMFLYIACLAEYTKSTISFPMTELLISFYLITFASPITLSSNVTNFLSPLTWSSAIFLTFFLITALIVIVKMTESFKGSLVKLF